MSRIFRCVMSALVIALLFLSQSSVQARNEKKGGSATPHGFQKGLKKGWGVSTVPPRLEQRQKDRLESTELTPWALQKIDQNATLIV